MSSSIKSTAASKASAIKLTSWTSLVIRLLEFVLGLTVLGSYASDLQHPPKDFKDGKWVFATITATLSVFAAVIHGFMPFVDALSTSAYVVWDLIVSILFWAVFGSFAKMYLHQKDSKRMSNIIWIDLICAMLWLASAFGGLVRVYKRKSRFEVTEKV
ncbi:MAG: hypothetical protein Q9160_005927 [Pyrenula sp. 1 TL-2023]